MAFNRRKLECSRYSNIHSVNFAVLVLLMSSGRRSFVCLFLLSVIMLPFVRSQKISKPVSVGCFRSKDEDVYK